MQLGMVLCIFTITVVLSLPCLQTLWRTIPTYFYIFVYIFAAARAPRNVDVQREGDGSSMSVAWDPLSPVEARGFLEFYQVAYMQSTTQRKRQVTTCLQAPAVCMQSPCQVCPNQSMVTIGGLVGGAAYSVTVGARNGAGPGTVSEPFPALCEFSTGGMENLCISHIHLSVSPDSRHQ